jgi:hypothetical protein
MLNQPTTMPIILDYKFFVKLVIVLFIVMIILSFNYQIMSIIYCEFTNFECMTLYVLVYDYMLLFFYL